MILVSNNLRMMMMMMMMMMMVMMTMMMMMTQENSTFSGVGGRSCRTACMNKSLRRCRKVMLRRKGEGGGWCAWKSLFYSLY